MLGNLKTERFANNTLEVRDYDSRSRLTRLTVQGPNDEVLKVYEYTYDFADRMTQEREVAGGTRNYEYDSNGQLVRYSYRVGASLQELHEYEYDAVGNMTRSLRNGIESLWTYGTTGKMLSQTIDGVTTQFSYDANGNLLNAIANGVEVASYQWNTQGRLVSVRQSVNGIISTVQYTYDYTGLMTQRTENGVVTSYVYDRSGKIPTLIRSTVNGVHEYYTHAERILARDGGANPSYYHMDALGNIRFQTNNQAQVNSRLAYVPFGELSTSSLDSQAIGQVQFQFAGEAYDPTTNLVYLRQRHYKPSLSRFISTDSFQGIEQDPLSQQAYQYAYNSPITHKDPSGEVSVPSLAELSVAASIVVTIGTIGAIQVLAGSGGLSGNEIDYSGPFLSFGIGASFGVGFSVDLYTGLLGSSQSFVGGPTVKEDTGSQVDWSILRHRPRDFCKPRTQRGCRNRGFAVESVNEVSRWLSLKRCFDNYGFVSAGHHRNSPRAFMTLGMAKGSQSGGNAFGLAFGSNANIKTGVYLAASVSVDKEDADYIRGIEARATKMFNEAFANYF